MLGMREEIEAAIALLQKVLAGLNQQEPFFPQSAKERLEDGVCLNCHKPIQDEKPRRGCHSACYHRIWERIREGKISEFDAIEQGILAPKSKPGRPRIVDDKLSQLLDSATVEQFKQDTGKKKPRKV